MVGREVGCLLLWVVGRGGTVGGGQGGGLSVAVGGGQGGGLCVASSGPWRPLFHPGFVKISLLQVKA